LWPFGGRTFGSRNCVFACRWPFNVCFVQIYHQQLLFDVLWRWSRAHIKKLMAVVVSMSSRVA
jgi:hypothetical protein